jgi:hypothetical protein
MHATHAIPHDLFAAGSILGMIQALASYGPSWSSVGPLLLGLAAIINALSNLARAAGHGDPGSNLAHPSGSHMVAASSFRGVGKML